MKLERIAVCLRPYGLNGKKLHRIYFFNETGVIFSSRSGWLEKSDIQNSCKYYSSIDVESIEIDEPIRKIKKDLNIKKNFYIKAEKIAEWESMQFLKDEYDLYIYVDNNKVKFQKTDEKTQDEEGSTYIQTVKYTEFLISGLTSEPFTTVNQTILTTRDTNEKMQADKILKIIEDEKLYINLSDYDLCKLLKVFNITKK